MEWNRRHFLENVQKWGFEDLGDPRVVLLIVLCRSVVVNPGMVCQHITAQRSAAQFMPAATTLPSLSPPMPTPVCARPEKGHARLPPLQPIRHAAHHPICLFPCSPAALQSSPRVLDSSSRPSAQLTGSQSSDCWHVVRRPRPLQDAIRSIAAACHTQGGLNHVTEIMS